MAFQKFDQEKINELKAKTSTKPHCVNRVIITQEQFDAILMDPSLTVVEKHFHSKLETNQVLFVIKDNEIDFVAVKEVSDTGTVIYKEV